MKKISRLFFSVASAALISLSLFACSEPASDDNSFDPSNSIPENPPAAVGEDPFKGKTIASEYSAKYIFSTDGTCENPGSFINKYKYSYNAEKKELYLLPQSYNFNGKTLTSFQEYADIMKKEYLNMYPNMSQEVIDISIQLNGLSYFGLRTYSYEISGSSVTLTLKPEVGLSTFSNNADGIYLTNFGLQFSVPSGGFYSGKATINKAEKKISCNKFWFSSDGQNFEEKAGKFVATYTENGDGTITLKVLEKSDFLSFVPDTVVLGNWESSNPTTYTIE